MHRSLLLIVLLIATRPLAADRPEAPWPGPDGSFVYVEGEDFNTQGEGWQVESLQRSREGYTSAARMKVISGRFKGDGIATCDVTVPADGDYRVWVHLSRWPAQTDRHRGPFKFSIAQADERSEHVFDQAWAGPEPARKVYTCRLMWEAAEATVALKAGSATLQLSKIGSEKTSSSTRRIDCVLLTTDHDYKANERDFVPQTYMRFHIREASIDSGYMEFFITYMRKPWSQHIAMDRLGVHQGVRGKRGHFYQVGDVTPWVNVSRYLYNSSPGKVMVRFTKLYSYEDAEHADYAMDFAPRPDADAIVKTIERSGPGGFMYMTMPSDLSGAALPKSDLTYAEERLAMVKKLPAITFGKRPEIFPLMVARPANPARHSPGVAEIELECIRYLGTNGLNSELSDLEVNAGQRFGIGHQRMWFMGEGGFNDPQLDKMQEYIERGAAHFADDPHAERITAIRLMDEATAHPLSTMAKRDVDHAAFRRWLTDRGVSASELGAASMEDVFVVDERAADPPQRYYWSQRFRAWTVANFFRHATALIDKHYPGDAEQLTTQNYSDGAVYMANMYSQGNDYYTWFKDVKALGTAMSEDWTNLGATWQLCGWNVALLRSATRYHGQRIAMYDIASFGRRPIDVKLKALSDIAQGAKEISFYDYTPQYRTNSSVFGERPDIFVAIAEVTREIGAAEHVLFDAMPHKAETAILYSRAYDIWNVDHDNSLGNERMLTYLALRHGHVPVDIISDDDVHEIGLDGLKVIYAFGEQIDERAIAPLANWVKAGGTLVLSPGAISSDQMSRKTDALDRALGLRRTAAEVLQPFHHSSRYACIILKPKGAVSLEGGDQVGLLARSQRFDLNDDAEVLARFEDGSAAAAKINVGKGRVYLIGFLPAVAYMQQAHQHYAVGREINQATAGPFMEEDMDDESAHGPAAEERVPPLKNVALAMAALSDDPAMQNADAIRIPRREYSYCPFAYPKPLRDFIITPALDAGAARPVTVDRPVVEATLMESDDGWVLPLANYTGAPLDSVTVTLHLRRADAGRVFSSRQGELKVQRDDGVIRVVLPLESTDFVFGDWLNELQ